tara:strand:+ start:422 stop:823 length:402 start_codon:yes stop_codon:yes gene_type:complete
MEYGNYALKLDHSTDYLKSQVEVIGVEQPLGTVMYHDERTLVIKVPGHKVWRGRGLQGTEYGYVGTYCQVFSLSMANRSQAKETGVIQWAHLVAEFSANPKEEHWPSECSDCVELFGRDRLPNRPVAEKHEGL